MSVCMYCGVELLNDQEDVCQACKMRINTFKKVQPEDEEVETVEPGASETEESEPEEAFEIPEKGEMLAGLYQVADQMTSKQAEPEVARSALENIQVNVSAVFDMMITDMENIPAEVEDYGENLKDSLERIEFLFQTGIYEMSLYINDGNPTHVDYGMMLCQIAEDRFLGLLYKIKAEATGNPFEGFSDVPGQLASELKTGGITKQQFDKEFKLLNNTFKDLMRDARLNIASAFEMVEKYDGANDSVMTGALESFKLAETQLSNIILNLHSQEEIKAVFADTLEELEEE